MVPIRAFQRGRRFHVLKAAVEGVDLDRRVVVTEAGPRPYDYLIVALGSVTTLPRLPGLREYARPFRTVGHAIDLRNRLVDALEQGHHAESADERRSWLTFVVGGGGDTGVELAATIQEFLDHGLLKQYPWLAERNGGGPPFRVVVVGRGERLLPLAPPATSAAIASRLAELGVEVRTGTAVTAVEPRRIVTDRGDVPACTLFWAAGIEPSPVLRDVPVEKQKGGALVVDERLALPSHPEVYVVGDAAWANDGVTGQPCPPTAQAANQQGAYAGRALAARLGGRQPARFRWRSKGHLVLLGHHGAVAEIGRLRFAGWPAWAAWHGFYLSRVPSWRHRVRLVNDWWLAAALGRDSSQIRL